MVTVGGCSPAVVISLPTAHTHIRTQTHVHTYSPVHRRKSSTDPTGPSRPMPSTGVPDANRLLPSRDSPTHKSMGLGGGRGTIPSGYESGIIDTPMSGDQSLRTNEFDPLVSVSHVNHDSAEHLKFPLGDKMSMKSQIDLISESAVKVSATDLDQIFDSDDGEEDSQSSEVTHFHFGSSLEGGRPGEDKMDTTSVRKLTKLLPTDPGLLSELSRIYPTPPSVESIEEKFDDVRMGGEEKLEPLSSSPSWEVGNAFVDEELVCVPREYAPLPCLVSMNIALPKECVFLQVSNNASGSLEKNGSSLTSSRTAGSSNSEPQKFIFPPPLANRSHKIEGLSLPLASRKQLRKSPHIFTPQLLTSSPAFPPRGPTPHPFHHRISTASATPLESPFDATITPTPLSATANRLMPVLPEAHALYINLALLDSALGANLSEPLSINTGPLFAQLQNFFSNRRMKLDSVASPGAVDNPPGSASGSLLCLQEEKPVMTFGIADYPSLGFREMGGGEATTPSSVDSWSSPLGSVTKVINWLLEERRREGVARGAQEQSKGQATPSSERDTSKCQTCWSLEPR